MNQESLHFGDCQVKLECIYLFELLVELPESFNLMFKSSGREFDQIRYALLEWVLNLKNGTMEKVRNKRNYFAAAIITLLYLVQVMHL